jgi:predicted alpha/beta superfamily hydrolase
LYSSVIFTQVNLCGISFEIITDMELYMQTIDKKNNKKRSRFFLFTFLITILLSTSISCRTLFDVVSPENDTEVELSQPEQNITNEEEIVIVDPSLASRVDVFTMNIPQLDNRERKIEVYLPPDYDQSDKSYPVFYLLDGEYLFNPPDDAGGDFRIDETLDRLYYEGKIEGMIAVGIWFVRDYLWSEYSPWVNNSMRDWVSEGNGEPVEGGEGSEFTQFIVETLKPEIDSRYRTLSDRENTAIGGFCRTAIIPVYAGLTYPDVFSQVMTMSPTVWLAEGGGQWLSNNQLINYIDGLTVANNIRFFIHVGTDESSGRRPPVEDQNGKRITYPQAYVEGAERLKLALLENGAPDDNVYLEIIEDSTGGRDFWGSRFEDALMWLMNRP